MCLTLFFSQLETEHCTCDPCCRHLLLEDLVSLSEGVVAQAHSHFLRSLCLGEGIMLSCRITVNISIRRRSLYAFVSAGDCAVLGKAHWCILM